jgi:hypothetical protein
VFFDETSENNFEAEMIALEWLIFLNSLYSENFLTTGLKKKFGGPLGPFCKREGYPSEILINCLLSGYLFVGFLLYLVPSLYKEYPALNCIDAE